MSPLTEPTKLTLAKSFTWNETVWNPRMVSGLALWLDAADTSTMYDATSGGSLVVNNGAVARWEDKSGNSRHATQATAGNRPVYTSSGLNSRNVITFDGVDDWMACASSLFSSQLSYSWFAVARRSTTAGIATLFSERIANEAASVQLTAVDTTSIINRATGTSASGLIDQTEAVSMPTTPQMLESIQAPSSGSAYRNALQTATNTATKASLAFRPFLIGSQYDSANGTVGFQQFWPGYICEFIVTQNTASADTRQRIEGYLAHKWGLTANLPAGHPYKTVPPTPTVQDIYRNNVSLMLHGNGSNGSTTIIDSSPNLLTVTPVGNAQISTAVADPFGNSTRGVLAFDGNGDTLTVNANLLDGSTWTAEAWIRAASLGTNDRTIFSQYNVASANRTVLRITTTGAVQIFNGAQGNTTSSVLITANQWYHIAFVRSSATTVTAFLNGVQVAQATNFAGPTSTNTMIGGFFGFPDDQWNGWMDEIRVTSIARYTSNFTPPTAPFPDF